MRPTRLAPGPMLLTIAGLLSGCVGAAPSPPPPPPAPVSALSPTAAPSGPAAPPRLVVAALGRSVAPLATTLDAYYRVQAAAHFNDQQTMETLRRSGLAFDVAAGDTCDELIRRGDTVLVRMRTGLSAGKEGWLPADQLRAAPPEPPSPSPVG